MNDGATLLYRASKYDCDSCGLNARCCPNTPARKMPRSIREPARDLARSIAKTETHGAFERRSRCCSPISSGSCDSIGSGYEDPAALTTNSSSPPPPRTSGSFQIDGVEVDMTQYCRFFSQVVRTESGWKLKSFEAIYQKDSIMAANPAEEVPIDWEAVQKFRASYRIWAWAMIKRGYSVPDDLLGDDRPDLVTEFYRKMKEWLHAA